MLARAPGVLRLRLEVMKGNEDVHQPRRGRGFRGHDSRLRWRLQHRDPERPPDACGQRHAEVTIRGFSGDFNIVTLNGRQMPVADARGVFFGINANIRTGDSRSFDFSNLASEGVSGLQVYKSGRVGVPSGGLGGTINIQTIQPLESGNQFSLGAKALSGLRQRWRDAGDKRSGQLDERCGHLRGVRLRFRPGARVLESHGDYTAARARNSQWQVSLRSRTAPHLPGRQP